MERNRKMIETDLFEFAYVPDWYGQLEQLAEMALPEAWRFRKPQTECKNTDTPILERYLHMMFRKMSIDYNTGETAYFHVENNCACFHTGLYTRQYQAIYDYIERTKHFISFDMEVIPELKNTKSLTPEQQKEKEGELIAKALQPGDVVVLLDEHGKEMRSVEFARWMEKKLVNVNKRLVFIIGGPYGFSQKVYDADNL